MKPTRRDFLSSCAVLALGPTVPRFLLAAAAEPTDARERILVVLQLSGGNDGLNTIIPTRDELYYRNRPTLAIPRDQALTIQDGLGFHPALSGLAKLTESGHAAVVQSVGYSNPNRSHFESMDIWHTGARKSDRGKSGWLGRYLDSHGRRADMPAIHFGTEQQPLALATQDVRVPSVRSVDRFRLHATLPIQSDVAELVRSPRPAENDLLGFVQSSASSALSAAKRVEAAQQDYRPAGPYPESPLGEKFQTIAQLIEAQLAARIYYVTLDGFDTHSRQARAHEGLLRQVSEAVTAFHQDLQAHGHGERVLLMAFSEFGRRVKENASAGTDHGAAAPVFFVGESIRPGIHGDHPRLDELQDGDLKYSTDFRCVYSAVLENWLRCDSVPILGQRYKPMGLFA